MFSAPRSLVQTKRASLKFSVASLFATAAWLGVSPLASAQNTVQTYSGATNGDVSVGTNYTPPGAPTVATDVLFSGSTAYTGLTDTANNGVFGSLNDTDTGAVTLSIATGKTLTLGGAGDLGNSVSGTATDLLYVGSTSTMTINGASLIVGLEGTSTGTFDIAGTATINAPITGTASTVGFTKTGVGSLTLTGANTALTGGVTIAQGTLSDGLNTALGPTTTTVTLGGAGTSNSANLIAITGTTVPNPINLATGATGTLTIGNAVTAGITTGFSGAITLNGDNLTIANNATQLNNVILTISGGVTGTGNVVVNDNNNVISSAGTLTIATVAFNNVGTVTNSGTGTGAFFLNTAGFGPNVRGFVQNSLTSPTEINVSNATFTGGSTTIAAGVVAFAGSSGGNPLALGTGSITLGAASGTASAYLDAFNPSGTFLNPLLTASGSTNNVLALGAGSYIVNSGGITLSNNLSLVASTSGLLTESGNIGGTGNLLFDAGGGTLTLGGNITSNGTITDAGYGSNVTLINGTLGASVTSVTVAGSSATRLSLVGSSANFKGSINLTSGILDLDSATALGNAGATVGTLTISGGTLAANVNGGSNALLTLTTVNPETWNGNFIFGLTLVNGNGIAGSLNTGTGAVSLGANVQVSELTAGTLTVGGTTGGTGNLTLNEQFTGGYGFTGVVNDTGTITTAGAGTGPITFTGAIGSNVTNFTQGTNGLTTFSVPVAYSGSTTINGGTLALTFSTTNTANIIPAASALTLGGGTLRLTTVAGSTGQAFASTTLNAGPSTDTFGGTAPTAFALNLGAITRNVGSTVVFTLPNTSTQTATNGIITSTGNTNGILGGWATVGNEFATVNNTNDVVSLDPANGYSTFTGADSTPTANYKLGSTTTAGGTATTAGETINSLNLQSNTATGSTITNAGTLTLTSGGLLASESTAATNVTHAINGGTLSSTNAQNDLIATVNNNTTGVTNLAISSVIADTTAGMSLTKSGNGTLTLTGTNTYTGATYFNGGIINIAADSGLGTAPATATTNQLDFAGGTLQLGAAITAINPNRGITLSGTGGTIDTNSFSTSYAGVIAGTGSFTKAGLGTLALTGANTYAGSTNINGGVLNITNDGNLGAVPAALQQNDITISGGTLQFNSSFGVNANRGILIGTGGATFDTGANTVYLPGQLAGTANGVANITKVGSGLLLLSPTGPSGSNTGAPNSYSFNGGEMFAPLAPASTATTYSASAPEAYNFNGGTQLYLTTSTNYGTGSSTNNYYLNSGGGTFDVALANSAFNYPGGGATPISGVINGPGALTKIGGGQINFTGLNTYTGSTSLSGSTVALTFKAIPTSGATSGYAGVFYNGVTAANAGALTLGGVTLASTGAASTANVQNFGGTTIGAGGDVLTIAAGTGTASVVLNLGALSRNVGGVVSFTQPTVNTTISSTNGYTTTTSNTNGILGGYAVVGTDFAYNNGTNIVALAGTSGAAGAYTGTFAASGNSATGNYLLANTGTTAVAVTGVGTQTINSLNLQSGTTGTVTVTQTSGSTLTLASGGLLADDTTNTAITQTISGGTLTTGNTQNDLIAYVTTGGSSSITTLTISSVIADGATTGTSLTKGGSGTLKLTAANTYTGATYLNGGIVNILTEGAASGAAGSLGAVPSTVTPAALTFSGGTLQLAAALNLNSNRGITLLSNGATIDTNGFASTYGGVIVGNGPLFKAGAGTLTLTAANPGFTGQTFISGGVLNISSDSTLGTLVDSTGVGNLGGNIVLAGGTLQFGAAFNINPARTISIPYAISGSTIDTNGYNTTYGGSIISNNSTLYKAGAGTLTLTGTVGMNGQLLVNGGGILFNGLYAGNQPIIVNPGAMIGGIGTLTTAAPINVVSSGNTSATIATISAGSGNTVGLLTLTSAAVTLSPNSVFNAVVASNGTAGINYSELLNPGGITVSTGATFTITTTPGATFTPGSILTLISNDVTAGGTANTFANTIATAGGYTFTADYTDNPGSFDVVVSVPEPSTWISGVLMLGMLGYHQRRRLGKLVGRI